MHGRRYRYSLYVTRTQTHARIRARARITRLCVRDAQRGELGERRGDERSPSARLKGHTAESYRDRARSRARCIVAITAEERDAVIPSAAIIFAPRARGATRKHVAR